MGIKVGVLAFQGDVSEHIEAFRRAGADPFPLKKAEDLDKVDALSLPGGESTTISRFLKEEKFFEVIPQKYHEGMAIFATCAGMILLSKEVVGNSVESMSLLDIKVRRNAYGRQKDSFEENILLEFDKKPFLAVFIRAPRIVEVGKKVDVISKFNGEPVMVQSGKILAASFHPELTEDTRIHKYFLKMMKRR